MLLAHLKIEMVVCSWCQKKIPSRPVAARAAVEARRVSHGICPSCLSTQMAALARLPATTPSALR